MWLTADIIVLKTLSRSVLKYIMSGLFEEKTGIYVCFYRVMWVDRCACGSWGGRFVTTTPPVGRRRKSFKKSLWCGINFWSLFGRTASVLQRRLVKHSLNSRRRPSIPSDTAVRRLPPATDRPGPPPPKQCTPRLTSFTSKWNDPIPA